MNNSNTPNWNKTLSEVLGHPTKTITRTSDRTGNDYQIEIIDTLGVLSTGLAQRKLTNGKVKYSYSIVDVKTGLEYAISVPNSIDVRFGTPLIFKNVRGGQIGTSSRGWYAAESVQKGKEN